jgi:hypothetical protein
MLEINKGLVLRCGDGQFTFRHYDDMATDAQLYELATELNSFQDCNLDKVLKVRVMEF